ncbi:hypothetical protein N1851_018842 [Merluccius polli]|uniref:Uncharacterized protein n=1 Tax=Merluccius polli TaxID=89951 RepID=A0AA47MMI7_MERPO|nr:hypothetical protein N1851_018842 [Merluccius polli]
MAGRRGIPVLLSALQLLCFLLIPASTRGTQHLYRCNDQDDHGPRCRQPRRPPVVLSKYALLCTEDMTVWRV